MNSNFNLLAELDETANQEFQRYLKLKKFKKGEYLLKKGQVCRYIFFIREGLVKLCFTNETKEFSCASLPKTEL
jgi:CRP-like cAMP-binding protein